jgi:hypothetical protein
MTITQVAWIGMNKVYILFRTKERLLRNSRSKEQRATKPHKFPGIDNLDRMVPFKNQL